MSKTLLPELRRLFALAALAALASSCAALGTLEGTTSPPPPEVPQPQQAGKPSPAAAEKPPPTPRTPPPAERRHATPGAVVARSKEFVVLIAGPGDTPRSLAARFLGSENRDWVITDFNGPDAVRTGNEVVVPLVAQNPVGVSPEGFQTVPILCYHRFGPKRAKMVVTPEDFQDQMEFLAQNGYRVLRLPDLVGFLEGRQPLPRKSVVITIDDGYRSSYQLAYPVLKKYGLPATIFVYTDFVGAADGLTWDQLTEMAASGIIELQPHSKTHSNLALRQPNEDAETYSRRVREEVSAPKRLLGDRLGLPMHTFAYPYGDANDLVVDHVQNTGYRLGATVIPGGNGFFANPFLLRRTMVFGEDDQEAFRAKVEVFRNQGLW